jgi:hypothetical protein
VLLQLPWIGNWLTVRQLNEFFFMLALLLTGWYFRMLCPGRWPRFETYVAGAICQRLHSVIPARVVAALRLVTVIKPSTCKLWRAASRAAVGGYLRHFTRIEAESIALMTMRYGVPRLVYGVIAGWMAYAVLTSGAFLPH